MTQASIETVENLLEKVLFYYERKEYPNAEKAVADLLAVAPDFHRGWFLKGIILEETGRADQAEECFVKSSNAHTLMLRLALQLQEKDPDRAQIYFDRVLEHDPGNNFMLYQRGLLYERLGNPEEAARSFRRISALREIMSRIFIPGGFLIFLLAGAAAMFQRGERVLSWIVLASALFCLVWMSRDSGLAIKMLLKKRKFS
ncbi:MAG: tetratricopeptide repeat protein [Thermodesulfovibrionales bacterium]